MTTYYVDSAGSNTAPYDTWAKAATSLATIAAIDAAGDTIYVASTHNESTAASVTWGWAGTTTSPTRIICADKTSGAPPSTVATGGAVTVTGSAPILTIASTAAQIVYMYGMTFVCAATSGAGQSIASANGVFNDNCSFQVSGVAANNVITPGASIWLNCTIKFAAASQGIGGSTNGWRWNGGSLLSGGTSPTALFTTGGGAIVENVDFSNAASTINLAASTTGGVNQVFRNIKLPASWSGSLNSSTTGNNSTFALMNCDSSGTNYILHRQTQFGDVYSETGITRSGGATDGVTPLSWKMVSLAASGTFPITALQSGEIQIWNNDNSGATKTLTVEFIHDNATGLKNNEIWVEVDYYGASGNPQGSLASSAMANVLATPTTYSASSVTWNGTGGMSNPNKQTMTVQFVPLLKGMIIVTIKLCKSAYTVYVDPPQFASLT